MRRVRSKKVSENKVLIKIIIIIIIRRRRRQINYTFALLAL
jgi:hypothetical protein